MSKTAEQVRALRNDLHAWIEEHELAHDVQWLTPAEFYGEKSQIEGPPCYLVLLPGDELCDLLWGGPTGAPVRSDAEQRRAEFEAIVARHGFSLNGDQGATACFSCAEEVQADEDRHMAKDREAKDYLQELEATGWKREGNTLVHPQDPERSVIYDPFQQEFIFSAKQAELISAELRRQRNERPSAG